MGTGGVMPVKEDAFSRSDKSRAQRQVGIECSSRYRRRECANIFIELCSKYSVAVDEKKEILRNRRQPRDPIPRSTEPARLHSGGKSALIELFGLDIPGVLILRY
jgi:hypothetical protein